MYVGRLVKFVLDNIPDGEFSMWLYMYNRPKVPRKIEEINGDDVRLAGVPHTVQKSWIEPVTYTEPTEHDMNCFVAEQIVQGNIWIFSNSADPLESAKPWQWDEAKWLHKLWHGYPLEIEEYLRITEKIRDNSYFRTAIPIMGWAFRYSDFLNLYLVKFNDSDTTWHEYFGFSEESLKLSNSLKTVGPSDILEVPKKSGRIR